MHFRDNPCFSYRMPGGQWSAIVINCSDLGCRATTRVAATGVDLAVLDVNRAGFRVMTDKTFDSAGRWVLQASFYRLNAVRAW